MIDELMKYLPAITPGCLFLIGILGQPPEWVKPKRPGAYGRKHT